jgi:hypothetical protein
MPFWWKPYEKLLETKPVDGVEAVRDLIAKEIVEALQTFPPSDIAFEDPALEKKFSGRVHELPRVSVELGALVLDLAALDIGHENERIDHMFRNETHRAAAPTDSHVEVLHLLWRGVVEHLYARKDEATGILKSKDLIWIVERAKQRWLSAAPS